MGVTRFKPGLKKAPFVLLALLALGVIASTHSVKTGSSAAPVRHVEALVTRAVHDRSASLRGLAAQPAAPATTVEVGLAEGNEVDAANAAPQPGIPDLGQAEQTTPGPRPAIP